MATSSAIRDLLHLTEQPHITSLAGGLPDPAHFPVARLRRAVDHVLVSDPAAALQYGPTEGLRPLRARVAEATGRPVDHVIITAGSQQALDLLARTLVRPGDPVVLAEPAYVGALQVLRAAGAELRPVPSDGEGLDVDALADALRDGLRPSLVYVVSNFDNPTGATLSDPRRHHLAALADRYGFWIVDDDPYGALRWSGTAPEPLAARTDRVITLGSSSKVLCPGLRVGWLVAPAAEARGAAVAKQGADLHTSSLSQAIVADLLADQPFLVAHLDRLRTTYGRRARTLAHALHHHLGDRVSFDAPDGGMFLWAELRDPDGHLVDTDALLPLALDAGTAFVPGGAFGVRDPHRGRVRLSFATAGADQLEEAARRLGAALDAWGKLAVDRERGASWTSPSSPSRTTSAPWAPSTPT